MKLAVSAYSFLQAMRDGRMKFEDVIPKANALGYNGVEMLRWEETTQEMLKLAKQLKHISDCEGIPIVSYTTGSDFLKNDLRKQVDTLKQEVEIACVLGVKRMRHDSTAGFDAAGKQYTVDEALPIVADGYRQVTEFAKSMGVVTMMENHGHFFQNSLRVKRLIETVNNTNFKWLVDIGNFMCVEEMPTEAVKRAAPYAEHIHVKDFHFKAKGEYIPPQGWFATAGGNYLRGSIIGHGVVNVEQCLKTIKQSGYDGWYSIEFEGMEDCFKALEYDLVNLKSMLAEDK